MSRRGSSQCQGAREQDDEARARVLRKAGSVTTKKAFLIKGRLILYKFKFKLLFNRGLFKPSEARQTVFESNLRLPLNER